MCLKNELAFSLVGLNFIKGIVIAIGVVPSWEVQMAKSDSELRLMVFEIGTCRGRSLGIEDEQDWC